MSDFQWCHGPECHEKKTTDRVRGVKGSKVLRTKRIKDNPHCNQYYPPYKYFCSQHCYNDFFIKHIDQIIAIAPRTEALETPILDPERKTHTTEYGYSYTNTKIEVDNTRTNDIG